MKISNKKGFTIVELIVVIATLAILAAILIPTFAGIIKKANDSAYQQERTNQMIQDAVEKIEKGDDNYMSWEDVEKAIAEAIKNGDSITDKIIAIYADKQNTGLTAEQLTAILDAIANKKFSDTQVKVILEGVQSGNASLTKEQIDEIIAKLPQVGITQEDIAAAVKEIVGNNDIATQINNAIKEAIKNIPTLDEEKTAEIVARIFDSLVAKKEKADFEALYPENNFVARIGLTGYDSLGNTSGTTGAISASTICSDVHKTVVLLKDVDLGTSYIRIPTACNFTLDLNGHSITASGYQIFSKPGGNVTGKINIINTSATQATLSVLRNGSSTYIIDLGGRKLTIGQLDDKGNSINSNIKFIAKRIDGGTSNTPAVISLGNNSNVIINGG